TRSDKIKFFRNRSDSLQFELLPIKDGLLPRCGRGARSKVRIVTQQEGIGFEEEGATRHFHVELFIVHPTLDPADISSALGLEAHNAHRVGDPRKTPKGTPLTGNYWDTRWRHCVKCSVTDQWYVAEITRF